MPTPADTNESALMDQIKALPPERRNEVRTFVEFLASQERRRALGDFLAVSGKVAEAGVPEMSSEQIEAEIKALRAQRRAARS